MSAPSYANLMRVFNAAKALRLHQHAYSKSPHTQSGQKAVWAGQTLDEALRAAGEQIPTTADEQPMLFPPPSSRGAR